MALPRQVGPGRKKYEVVETTARLVGWHEGPYHTVRVLWAIVWGAFDPRQRSGGISSPTRISRMRGRGHILGDIRCSVDANPREEVSSTGFDTNQSHHCPKPMELKRFEIIGFRRLSSVLLRDTAPLSFVQDIANASDHAPLFFRTGKGQSDANRDSLHQPRIKQGLDSSLYDEGPPRLPSLLDATPPAAAGTTQGGLEIGLVGFHLDSPATSTPPLPLAHGTNEHPRNPGRGEIGIRLKPRIAVTRTRWGTAWDRHHGCDVAWFRGALRIPIGTLPRERD